MHIHMCICGSLSIVELSKPSPMETHPSPSRSAEDDGDDDYEDDDDDDDDDDGDDDDAAAAAAAAIPPPLLLLQQPLKRARPNLPAAPRPGNLCKEEEGE